MKATVYGKRYDTDKCEVLGTIDHHSSNGNYSGTTSLIRASNGELLIWCDSNGQDLHMHSYVCSFYGSGRVIDEFAMTDEQEAKCAALGLIEIVD